MNVVFYGASVTAQKFKTGYFQNLEELFKRSLLPVKLGRVAYGASHFDWAGFAIIKKVIDLKPDICFLDWVTPSSKKFDVNKIDFINRVLLQHGCLPIWLLLPRIDDFESKRICCDQIRDYCSTHSIPYYEVVRECSITKEGLGDLLRDSVHTNELGALKYACFFEELIDRFFHADTSALCEKAISTYSQSESLYELLGNYSIRGEISASKKLKLDFFANDSSLAVEGIEVFCFWENWAENPIFNYGGL